MKLLILYRRRWWLFYLPVLLCAAALLWLSATRWMALPPTKAVIAAGSAQNGYARLAQRFAEHLDRIGVQTEIVYSPDQKGALDKLSDPSDPVNIGFGHGIYADSPLKVEALAVIGNEPIWIFANRTGPDSLSEARGLRIAGGAEGSSTAMATRRLLAHAGVDPASVKFSTLGGQAASEALADGTVDLVFIATSEDALAVQTLSQLGGVKLLGVARANALFTSYQRLQPLLLPEGSIELRANVPPRDLTVMGLQTHLLVQPNVHPALQRALMDAAVEILDTPNFLQRQGQFPSFRGTDFALSQTARAYSLGTRPWLETVLPYRVAQQAELFLYAALPIGLVTLFILAWIPQVFDWRVRAALNHFYGELKFLENEMESTAAKSPMALKPLLEKLDNIERQVVEMELPNEFSEHWYTLREHLGAAQDRLLKLRSR